MCFTTLESAFYPANAPCHEVILEEFLNNIFDLKILEKHQSVFENKTQLCIYLGVLHILSKAESVTFN